MLTGASGYCRAILSFAIITNVVVNLKFNHLADDFPIHWVVVWPLAFHHSASPGLRGLAETKSEVQFLLSR